MQAAPREIDRKDLEFCKDEDGNDICLGKGGFGQVTHALAATPSTCVPPGRQLVRGFPLFWLKTHGIVPLLHQAAGPCPASTVPVLPHCEPLAPNG